MKRLALAMLLIASPVFAQQTPHFALSNRIALGGEGGWDYLMVDPSGKQLFVSRGTHVQVVDLATLKQAGDIPNTNGVHGIAIVPDLKLGFTSNGRDSTLTVFDAATLATKGSVQIPSRGPDAILYDPESHHVFTMNHSGNSVSAIDPRSLSVISTTPIGGTAEAAVVHNHMLYVNLEDKSEIAVVDTRNLQVEDHWSLAPCEEPTGMALDAKNDRLIVGCGNKLMALVDAKSGKVVATAPVGSGVDGVAFDAALSLAFSSNGEGSVTVVRESTPNSLDVVETVPTQRGARTIALDPRTHTLYLSTAQFGQAPAPTAEQPRPRPPMVPGSFTVLVVSPTH